MNRIRLYYSLFKDQHQAMFQNSFVPFKTQYGKPRLGAFARGFFLFLFATIISTTSCTHKPLVVATAIPDGNYPADVAKILVGKCTNAGCHNAASYQNAAGLLLDTWEHALRGGATGAQVVPYSPLYSPLLYYTNTDPSLGIVASTPFHNETPLTHDEYMTLHNWIKNGAPDKNGNIPFAADAATRQKIYLTIQGCNLVAVIDAKTRLIMRYINVGDATNKSPHDIVTSSDGMYAYIPFFNGSFLQKLNLTTDTVAATANLASFAIGGTGQWSKVILSPMDTAVMVSGWIPNGCVVTLRTATMQRNPKLSVDALTGGTSLFPYPHGLAANASFDTFYATLQNNIIKYTFNSFGILTWHKIITASGQPHQIRFTPDRSKYFVTCPDPTSPATNEVRVYDTRTDTFIKAITTGTDPLEMDISTSMNYLFVTCTEDAANPLPNRRGSVYVIDYNTLEIVKKIYGDFYQPHGIAVDEQNKLIFIPSRNADPTGPAPHHATSCSGRPGWYSVYMLTTLEPADKKRYDVPVDPYSISTRFK